MIKKQRVVIIKLHHTNISYNTKSTSFHIFSCIFIRVATENVRRTYVLRTPVLTCIYKCESIADNGGKPLLK
jgi:hypothetical protein